MAMTISKLKHKQATIFLVAILWLGFVPHCIAGFIDTGQGARPIGFGRAYTAIANDVHSIFYNPAGLAKLNQLAFTTMYARLYPGISSDNLHYEMVAATVPLSFIGRIGIALTNLNVDVYKENMIYLSYGRQLPFNLAVGGNFKLLRWSAEGDVDPIREVRDKNFSKTSFAFDIGVMYQLSLPFIENKLKPGRLQLGLMLQDINQPNISQSGLDGGKMPFGLTAGMGYLSDNLIIAADISRKNEFTRMHIGAEYLLYSLQMKSWNFAFLVRGGGIRILNDRKGGEFDLGFGLSIRNILIDYVYVYPLVLKDVDGSHKISLSFQL